MDLLLIRDIFAILTLVSSWIMIFRDQKIKKENLNLKEQLEDSRQRANAMSEELYDLRNKTIPRLKSERDELQKEATRLAASKAERDIETLIRSLEKISGGKTE